MRQVRFTFEGFVIDATLRDTPTADAIHAILPVEAEIASLGGEIRFPVPVSVALEAGVRGTPGAGQIGYRPNGKMVAIAFGPAQAEDAAGAGEPVNLWADAAGDLGKLEKLAPGTRVLLTWI